jgi:hypothetical protein
LQITAAVEPRCQEWKEGSMDILGWLWWVVSSLLTGVVSLIWFLISGWVSTLLQIAVLVIVIYFLKYGWQAAPAEIWRRSRAFAGFFLGWIRARDTVASEREVVQTVRVVKVKEFGDVNISTLLSLLMLVGLVLVARI